MRTPHAATISIALWLTRVAARPVSGQPSAANPAVSGSNQIMSVESKVLDSSVRALSSSGRDGVDSIKNANPDPKSQIYPKRSDSDAPYSLSEQELRSKIYFPETFSESPSKRPVILVPGTAAMAGSTYRSNLGHLLAASDFADPLWVNIPKSCL